MPRDQPLTRLGAALCAGLLLLILGALFWARAPRATNSTRALAPRPGAPSAIAPPARPARTPLPGEPRSPDEPAASAGAPRTVAARAAGTAPLVQLDSRPLIGVVLDESGKPVAGAQLRPWRLEAGVETLDPRRATTSDDRGTFELAGEPRGSTLVRVEHEDYTSEEVHLAGVGVELVTLRRRVPVRGQVETHDGRPAAGSRVGYRAAGSLHAWRIALADERGAFEFAPAEAGALSVEVRGPHGLLEARELLPRAGEPLRLVLPATRPVRAQVLGADAEPLAEARVVLLRAGEARALEACISDSRGLVSFETAPDEPLELVTRHARARFTRRAARRDGELTLLRGEACAVLRVDSTSDAEFDVELIPDPALADVVRRLRKRAGQVLVCGGLAPGAWRFEARSPTSRDFPTQRSEAFEVRALLLEPGGELHLELEPPASGSLIGGADPFPGPGLRVELISEHGGRARAACPLDAEGAFRFAAVPPGRYQLRFSAPGGGSWYDPGSVEVVAGQQTVHWVGLPTDERVIRINDAEGRALPGAAASLATSRLECRLLGSSLAPRPTTERVDALGSHRYTAASSSAGADEYGLLHLWLTPPHLPGEPPWLRVTAAGFEPDEFPLLPTVSSTILTPQP